MIAETINSLSAERARLSEAYSRISDALPSLESSSGSQLSVNLDTDIPGTVGSINNCNERIATALGLVEAIVGQKHKDFKLIPKSLLTALPKSLSEITKHLNDMLVRIEQVESDGGLRDVGDDLIIHSVNQSSHPNVDLKTYYQNADNQVDQALKGSYELLSIIAPQSYDAFSGAMAGIESLQNELGKVRREITSLRKDAKSKATQINNQSTQASSNLENIETKVDDISSKAESFQQNIDKLGAEAESGTAKIKTLLTDISETTEQAKALRIKVDEYEVLFTDFINRSNERKAKFEEGTRDLEALRQEMHEASNENKKYIEESKHALGWTTASGLADSFSKSAEELNRPLLLSRLMFYFSIVVLFASAAIAFNGIPPLRQYIEVPRFPALEGQVDASLLAAMLSVVSVKIAMLVPAALFVGFASRRHRALFNQHQLYIYKKTIASALPGFKDHAEKHQEAMAAAAFARLLFNPQEDASRDLSHETGGQGWLSNWLERIVSKGMKSAMLDRDK